MKSYQRDEIKEYIGNEKQLFGIKSYTFDEGRAKGTKAIEIDSGAGLNITVLPDRCMDIAYAKMGYENVCYIASPDVVAPTFYNMDGQEWLRSFGGGLLTTCGLSQIGNDDEAVGLHGRIGNSPAYDICHGSDWENGKYRMFVSGKIREAALFSENIILNRRISMTAGDDFFVIDDKIENDGIRDFKLLILYHFNFGYPLLDDGTEMIADVNSVWTNDKNAELKIEDSLYYDKPQKKGETLLYFYDLNADDKNKVKVELVNKKRKSGIYVKYDKSILPCFTQWKNTSVQEYVAGIEPGTGLPIGRRQNIDQNRFKKIKPGETVNIHIEVGSIKF